MHERLAEQRERWRKGDHVPVEAFLERDPDLAREPEKLLDLIYGEFLLREETGQPLDPEEYRRRFPHLA